MNNSMPYQPDSQPSSPNGFSHHKTSNKSSSAKRTALMVAFVAVLVGFRSRINYGRIRNGCRAFYRLVAMPEEAWDDYYKSLDVLAKPMLTTKQDELMVGAWYKIINLFCDLGELEKMYFPPLVDPNVGLVENQILVENKMALGAASYEWNSTYVSKVGEELSDRLKQRYVQTIHGDKQILPVGEPVPAGASVRPMDVLDLGCGKGRIAHDMMVYTGGHVKGLNIDVTQLQNAMHFALKRNLWPERLDFRHGSFNNPLPYADESFDFVYEVGAFTYMIDKMAVFSEIYRVLRPGGAFVYQDWTDTGYDSNNATQAQMVLNIKLISGLIELHDPNELAQVAQQVGFEVLFNDDGGYDAKPSTQLLSIGSFKTVDTFIETLIRWGLMPQRFLKAWRTLRTGGIHDLRESIDSGMLNMGHVLLIRKPLD